MSYPDYIDRNHIVTISGSMRFFGEMLEQARRLTSEGMIVLMPFVIKPTDKEAKIVHPLNFEKIDLSGKLFVVNVGGYIGEQTLEEIVYARKEGKTVIFLEDIKLAGMYTRYIPAYTTMATPVQYVFA